MKTNKNRLIFQLFTDRIINENFIWGEFVMEKTNNQQRLTYIDVARAIGILSVVLGHMCQFYRDNFEIDHDLLIQFIYTFHMPLFFLLSGILFSDKSIFESSFLKFFIKKIKTLFIPYLFLDITAGIYNLVKYSSMNLSFVIAVIKNTLTLHCNVGANWFLSALFIGEIGIYLFLKYFNKSIFKHLIWIPFLFINLYYPFTTHWINIVVRGIIAFVFILLGYHLKEYYKSDLNKRWDIIILSFTLTYVITQLNGQIDLWGSRIGNPILCLVGGLIGTYWIIGLSKQITSKLLVFIGQNTMTMMGMHMIVLTFIWECCSQTFFSAIPSLSTNILGQIMIFVLTIAGNLPIMYLYNRYIPFLIGKFPK